MSTNIPPTGPGANPNVQPPEDNQEKDSQNNDAESQHRPQTAVGERIKGKSLFSRARGIKQADSETGSIMRNTKDNSDKPDSSPDGATAGDGDN